MSDERTLPLLDEAIAEELREHGTLLPPWRKYPDTSPYDTTWRMGGGEWYLMLFWKWARDQSPEAWIAYLRANAPIPLDWAVWSATAAHLIADDSPTPSAGVRRLAELGLVDFEAWSRREASLATRGQG